MGLNLAHHIYIYFVTLFAPLFRLLVDENFLFYFLWNFLYRTVLHSIKASGFYFRSLIFLFFIVHIVRDLCILLNMFVYTVYEVYDVMSRGNEVGHSVYVYVVKCLGDFIYLIQCLLSVQDGHIKGFSKTLIFTSWLNLRVRFTSAWRQLLMLNFLL